MHRARTFLLAGAIVAAIMAVGIASAAAFSGVGDIVRPSTAASPTPSPGSFKSNEATAHETGETAAREAAENSGQAGPGGPGGPHGPMTCSNETSAHETGEPATREAAEPKVQCPAPSPGATTTP